MPSTKRKAKGLTSFSPTRKGRTAVVRLSRSQSPLRKHIESFPRVPPKTPQHRFLASRFGCNKGHFGRMHKEHKLNDIGIAQLNKNMVLIVESTALPMQCLGSL